MVNWKLEKTALIFDRRRVLDTGTGSPPCQTRSVSGLPLVLDERGGDKFLGFFLLLGYWHFQTNFSFHDLPNCELNLTNKDIKRLRTIF